MNQPKGRLSYVQFRGNENVESTIPKQTLSRWKKRKLDEQGLKILNVPTKNTNNGLLSSGYKRINSSSNYSLSNVSVLEDQFNHQEEAVTAGITTNESVEDVSPENEDELDQSSTNENDNNQNTSPSSDHEWYDEENETFPVNEDAENEDELDQSSTNENDNNQNTSPSSDHEWYDEENETFPVNEDKKAEYIFILLGLQVKHKLTKVAVTDICKFVNLIKGENILPPSYYLFESATKSYKTKVEIHNLCPECNCYVGKTDNSCVECECGHNVVIKENVAKGNFFLYLPLEAQLKCMMENKYLKYKLNYINNRQKKVTTNIEDIFDGRIFKSTMDQFSRTIPGDTFVISLNFNTDGVPVFKSSKFGIWPILCSINNLPPLLRKKYILLVSLWFGDKKPNMNEFFKPFVSELNHLAANGFSYGTGEDIRMCYVLAMVAICDSVARPVLQNMIQFNGEYGCSFCLHPGETTVRGKGIARVYPLANFEKRNHTEWLQMAETASEENSVIRGIKGQSVLFTLMFFNMVSSFVPDYMHSILLGVVRQFFKLWFDSANHTMPWYIGNRAQEVDGKLLSIQPPYVLSRTPRSVGTSKFWKAHEWYNWIFHYSLVVLKGILPAPYLHHWAFLVKSVHTLLQESISKSEIYMAHSSLEAFVNTTEKLYGKEHLTFNVHQCVHLADSALDFGPLWAHSGFVFENFNGVLLDMVKSSKGVPQQITSSYQNLLIVNINSSVTTDISKHFLFQPTMLPKDSVLQSSEKIFILNGITMLGNSCVTIIEDSYRLAIASCTNTQIDKRTIVQQFQRIIVNNIVFHSSMYNKVKKRNSYTAILKDGKYFQIHTFIVVEDICYAIGYYLKTLQNQLVSNLPPNVVLNHIKTVKHDSESVSAVLALNLKSLALFIDSKECFGNHYLSLPPNSHDISM